VIADLVVGTKNTVKGRQDHPELKDSQTHVKPAFCSLSAKVGFRDGFR